MIMNKLLVIFAAIEDTESPTFTYCPNDISATTAADTSSTSVTWTEPTAVDNSGSVFYTKTHAAGDKFAVGTTTIVYYARDPSGNQASCSFDIIVTGKVLCVTCLVLMYLQRQTRKHATTGLSLLRWSITN